MSDVTAVHPTDRQRLAGVSRTHLRIEEVAQAMGISRALAYRWVSNGTLASIQVGRVRRVPLSAVLALQSDAER